MSLIVNRRAAKMDAFHPPAPGGGGLLDGSGATPDQALRVGAVWACLRLRADLISTLPVDLFRNVQGRPVEVPKSPFFRDPAAGQLWNEWMYATQFDLDRFGNAFGFVVARDAAMRPAQIELTEAGDWSFTKEKGRWRKRYKGKIVENEADIWHERQYVVAGLPWGLSPLAYAAWSTGHYLSAQQFALDWFTSGGAPSGTLQNTAQEVDPGAAAEIKRRFRAATSKRDVFVHGKDWVFTPAQGAASDAKFLDAMKTSVPDVARFLGVPADMIDAESSSGSITYANVTQRNLQLLTMNLGPAIVRREARFSHDLVAAPRFVKLNTDAILRMDPQGKITALATGVNSSIYTHDEARDLVDLPPLTSEQIAKEHEIKGTAPAPGTKTGVPA